MKKLIYIIYTLAIISVLNLIIIFVSNYFISYHKEVILGGNNIGLYLKENNNNSNLLSRSDNDIVSGILTYIDNNNFGAFGHGFKSNINEGEVIETKVVSVIKSDKLPGFTLVEPLKNNTIGYFTKNSNVGVFGNMYKFNNDKLIEVGMPRDIKKGKAYIKTTIKDNDINYYEIEITNINMFSKKNNIYFKVVDKNLIEQTGGLVKGMSGSPIIQNDKIIGAVSGSYKKNYLKGNGVFITRMLSNN